MRLITIILIAISIQYLSGQSENGLILYYPFDGNTQDLSGNNFDGELNGPTLDDGFDGSSNGSYFFDGVNDYIKIQYHESLDFEVGESFSISMWFRYSGNNEVQEQSDLISKWNFQHRDTAYSYSIRVTNELSSYTGRVSAGRFDSDDFGCKITASFLDSGNSISYADNQWHHLIFQVQNDQMELYIDGNLVDSGSDESICSLLNDDYILLGMRSYEVPPLTRAFHGNIDEVRIYNRTLTPSEISELSDNTSQNAYVGINTVGEFNLDIRNDAEDTDGADLQISTIAQDHFLRMKSGSDLDNKPRLFYPESDTFQITSFNPTIENENATLTLAPNKKLGIFQNNPQQTVEINGKIKIGDDGFAPSAGTLRFNKSSMTFEGYDSNEWKPLSSSSNSFLSAEGEVLVSSDRNTEIALDQDLSVKESGRYKLSLSVYLSSKINHLETEDSDIAQHTFDNNGSVYVYRNTSLIKTLSIGQKLSIKEGTNILYSYTPSSRNMTLILNLEEGDVIHLAGIMNTNGNSGLLNIDETWSVEIDGFYLEKIE